MNTRSAPWVVIAMVIAISGAVIHVAAVIGGPSWYAFFGAPPVIVESARAGTWVAPVGAVVIAGLMAICAAYAASAIGFIRKLPLQRTGLACIAAVCLLRAFVLIPLAVNHPELRNTFEVVAAIVWGLAGIGFAVGFWLCRSAVPPNPSIERTSSSGLRPLPAAAHVER